MASQRFPKRMYLKQMRRMRYQMSQWRREYEGAARSTTSTYLTRAFAARVACLETTIEALDTAFLELEGLPRLA